jgi:hypothetical protein
MSKLTKWIGATLREAAWAPVLVFLVHVCLDGASDIYARFPEFDIPMHFCGGVAIAFFFHRASWSASKFGIMGPFHPVNHVVLVFSLVCVAAVFWEFAEFVCDHAMGTRHQTGLDDTLLDMFLGITGGLVFLVVNQSIRRSTTT